MTRYDNIIVGVGEIGMPLYELMNGVFKTLPISQSRFKGNSEIEAECDFLHICLPGELKNFEQLVADYYNKYKPRFIFIHSTVFPGTTKTINFLIGKDVAIHCPVHGKHQNNQMKKDMLRYPKYLGVPEKMSDNDVEAAKNHFSRMGFASVIVFKKTATTEWAKLLSTTIFGLQIAFAQEVERICDEQGLDYGEVTHFFPIQRDVRKAPIFPGFIGGHCVMPNVKILKQIYGCGLWDWMEDSNEKKRIRDGVEVDKRGR